MGSVFSPYYVWAGRRDPEDHCALNVALYGPRGQRWTMTERPRGAVARDRTSFAIGPSSIRWEGGTLVFDIVERGATIPWPVRGTVRVVPEVRADLSFDLDPEGRHRWHPIAPRARIEVDMHEPALRWTGTGYLDSNFGDEPLEKGFCHWNWSRAHSGDDVIVFYEGERRNGSRFQLGVRLDAQGRWHDMPLPPPARLPRTLFWMPRETRADPGTRPRVLKTWTDAPFYARSALRTRLFGEELFAIHESLSLDRLRSPIVRHMLPYRMPRAR